MWKNSGVSNDLVLILQQIIEPLPISLEIQELIPRLDVRINFDEADNTTGGPNACRVNF